MLDLNTAQINAVLATVYKQIEKAYKDKIAKATEELRQNNDFGEFYDEIMALRKEADALVKKANAINTQISKKFRARRLYEYTTTKSKEEFVDACVRSKAGVGISLPSKADIKQEIILSTINCTELDSLVNALLSKYV